MNYGNRFIVSKNLPPTLKRIGYRFEVVDLTHPSDGGPVAVAWFKDEAPAIADAADRNFDPTVAAHPFPQAA